MIIITRTAVNIPAKRYFWPNEPLLLESVARKRAGPKLREIFLLLQPPVNHGFDRSIALLFAVDFTDSISAGVSSVQLGQVSLGSTNCDEQIDS